MTDRSTTTNKIPEKEMDPNVISKLIDMAHEAMENSYCPYSSFPVGCALLCDDGTIFTGCNVENATYCSSICAERTAIVKAVSNGKRKFKAISVAANLDYCVPCGICRQFLVEFGTDLIVILTNKNKEFQTCSLGNLLPRAFGPKDLEENLKKKAST